MRTSASLFYGKQKPLGMENQTQEFIWGKEPRVGRLLSCHQTCFFVPVDYGLFPLPWTKPDLHEGSEGRGRGVIYSLGLYFCQELWRQGWGSEMIFTWGKWNKKLRQMTCTRKHMLFLVRKFLSEEVNEDRK